MRSDQEQPAASDESSDPEDRAEESREEGYRQGGWRLSESDALEAERFGEIAGTLVLQGKPVLEAWVAANEWLDAHPKGLPEWVKVDSPVLLAKPKTMPPPKFVAELGRGVEAAISVPRAAPVPERRLCRYCGERKPYPAEFTTRRPETRGPRVSRRKCAGCSEKGVVRATVPADPIPPGPRKCMYCVETKVYPEDFRNPTRKHQTHKRKCTSCQKGGARADSPEDEDAPATEPSPPPTAPPPPARPTLPSAPMPATARPKLEAPVRTSPTPASKKKSEEIMPSVRDQIAQQLRVKPQTEAELVVSTGLGRSSIGNALRAMMADREARKEGTYAGVWSLGPQASSKAPASPRGSTDAALKAIARSQAKRAEPRARVKSPRAAASVGGRRSPPRVAERPAAEHIGLSIPAPPGPLESTSLVESLLEERARLVGVTYDKVRRIDELLASYKVAG